MPLPRREHEYVNDMVISNNRDVFDMREYHIALFVMASDSLVQRDNSLCLCFRTIQHCCTNWRSCTCFPEGAAATRGLVPWRCESSGGWNLAYTGKLFASVVWNETVCSLVFVKLYMTFCMTLNLIFIAMRTTVSHTFHSSAFMYRSLINLFSVLSNLNVVDGEFVMVAVNFRQVNVFTLVKVYVCVLGPVFYFSNMQCNSVYLLSLRNRWTHNRNHWQAHLTMVMNFSVPYQRGRFLDWLSSCQFVSDDYTPWGHRILKFTVIWHVSWDSSVSIVTRLQDGR
jgi:hypothetical protein